MPPPAQNDWAKQSKGTWNICQKHEAWNSCTRKEKTAITTTNIGGKVQSEGETCNNKCESWCGKSIQAKMEKLEQN